MKGEYGRVFVPEEGEPRKSPANLPGELWGITTFFNPGRSPVPRENLAVFSRGIRDQGLKLLIVELAFGERRFEVEDGYGDLVLRRRSNSVLWQKERLLNLGLEHLPASCDKVTWLDADILFENKTWVGETARLLESYVVIQPFETACWLPPGARKAGAELSKGLGAGQCLPGMAYTLARCGDRRRALADYFEHGHTGFAWAARRSLLDDHQLYDRRILGGGDVIIAHSLYGDQDFWRGFNYYCRQMSKKELTSIAEWGRALHEDVRGSIFYVPGRVLHLWHGRMAGRSYLDRLKILKENGYDPTNDINLDEGGCWRWASDKPELHRQAGEYFAGRTETGRTTAEEVVAGCEGTPS